MISNLCTASGKIYEIGKLVPSHHQYVDRLYQFDYVPDELSGCLHIKTHGDDKMINEDEVCFSFDSDQDIDVFILYPDKQPFLPKWLIEFERKRMNVTRMDSMASNLKGYFSIYKKQYKKGPVVLFGNSPSSMLAQNWYVETKGANYCMYSVCIKPAIDERF
ncbi:hypothetical protein [Breznakiella homolactica]|uniref:Uncharacterized protein n=1 Tax=Breznakiella homolactica TaxID=2798577 RepID=A0A7T7XQ12_9SPIR|nr:hypothetical protein [Breznakiella homolactica]QQO10395.1 hypothetical protein JFL75_05605 [Breznakiella homolactica]